MDLQTLSRRELQALCKSHGIRANMSNAAMAEALLQCLLPTVDRTDEIGRPPPPPRTAMKDVTNIEEEERTNRSQHGCPLPRGGRARRGKARKAGARRAEEAVVPPAPNTLPGNKRTVAEETAAAPVDAEEVAVGMRTRRSARSKVKIALDQNEDDVQAAAARKEQKADSSDAAIASAVVSDKSCGGSEDHAVVTVVEEEVTKPHEGGNVTRRAAPDKTHEDLQQGQRTEEEVATGKKRTRRSTRSKAAATARKGQNAESSESTKGPEVDPKDDEVVPVVEEATKPQEGKDVTVYKAQEEVQTGQVTAASEAMAAVEAEEEVATTKRRRKRSARSKARVAARKGQKGDSSDAVNGSTVSDDPKEEEQVVEVVEEGPTKPNEGEMPHPSETTGEREQISNVREFASLPKLEYSPILGVVSKPNAADASNKAVVADEEAAKEDGLTFSFEADLSNLLVNTLDRFAKPMPMYESTDKEERKGSECWWMLL